MQKESMRPTQPNWIEADGTEYGMEWNGMRSTSTNVILY